jgi:hypothetical protein
MNGAGRWISLKIYQMPACFTAVMHWWREDHTDGRCGRKIQAEENKSAWSDIRIFTILDFTGTSNNNNNVPREFKLSQNYPNPFNPVTVIKFDLPKGSHVLLQVYDANGRLVKVLMNDYRPAGVYNIEFDASSLSSGIYFYKLNAGEFADTRKMVVIK